MILSRKLIKSSIASLFFILLSTQLMSVDAFYANTNQKTQNNQAAIISSDNTEKTSLGLYSKDIKNKVSSILTDFSFDSELSIDNENSEDSQISEEQAKLHEFLNANSIKNSKLTSEVKNSLNKILEQNNAKSLLAVEIKQAPIEDIVLQVDEAYKGKIANVSYIETNIATNQNSSESNLELCYRHIGQW